MCTRTKYQNNADYIMETAKIMADTNTETPNLQSKVTAFMPAEILVLNF